MDYSGTMCNQTDARWGRMNHCHDFQSGKNKDFTNYRHPFDINHPTIPIWYC